MDLDEMQRAVDDILENGDPSAPLFSAEFQSALLAVARAAERFYSRFSLTERDEGVVVTGGLTELVDLRQALSRLRGDET